MYLICDLGASSADWGLFNPKTKGIITPSKSFQLDSESFADMLENDVCAWIDGVTDDRIVATCIAVAGRVEQGVARLTNGERWLVRSEEIREILEARGHGGVVHIINDFEALSLGVAALLNDESLKNSFTSIYGRFRYFAPGKRILVCGPGTGARGVATDAWR